MVRHIKLRHNGSLSPIWLEGVTRNSYIPQGFPSPKLDIGSILNNGTDKSGDPLTKLLDWAINHYTYVNSLGSIQTQPIVPPRTPSVLISLITSLLIIGPYQSQIFKELVAIFVIHVRLFR